MKKIQDADIEGKRVLLRADFNVAIENEDVKEKFKISACKESTDYLLSKSCKVALISHLGRPDGKIDPKYTLEHIADDVERILGLKVKFIDDCIGEKVKKGLDELSDNELLLLENVRYYPGEEDNDLEFSSRLAENYNLFINEAFSVCHRDQASVTGVAKLLPSFGGFWLQKEIENLNRIKDNPTHPAVAIIGGAKIETKLPLIQRFEKNYDRILVGGKVANEAIEQGLSFSQKVMLPEDFAKDKADIGPKAIDSFRKALEGAKTIVWNGPMGKFEQVEFAKGTYGILEAVIESGAFSLIGGGESVEMLEGKGLMDKISFVSTGGGAMLEYLSGNPMPGIEALEG